MKICGCTLPYEQCCGAIQLGPTYGPSPAHVRGPMVFLTDAQKKQLREFEDRHPWSPVDLDGVHA